MPLTLILDAQDHERVHFYERVVRPGGGVGAITWDLLFSLHIDNLNDLGADDALYEAVRTGAPVDVVGRLRQAE